MTVDTGTETDIADLPCDQLRLTGKGKIALATGGLDDLPEHVRDALHVLWYLEHHPLPLPTFTLSGEPVSMIVEDDGCDRLLLVESIPDPPARPGPAAG